MSSILLSDTESTVTFTSSLASSNNTDDNIKNRYYLEITHLPNDCGIKTLQSILIGIDSNIKSIHFRKEEKAAIITIFCKDSKCLTNLKEFITKFGGKSKLIKYSQYLSYNDDAYIWQYADSNYWKPYNSNMAKIIENMSINTNLTISYKSKIFLIEKYNKIHGRQINLKKENMRLIRRITLNVWISNNKY